MRHGYHGCMKADATLFIDHFVFTKKTVYMQRISDLVGTGHIHYVQGVVDIEKAGFLAGKFEARYTICQTKLQASRSRKAGMPSTRLRFLRRNENTTELDWILLQAPGGELDKSEKWRNALEDRVSVTGYELVRITKPNEPRPVWTWRYSRVQHDELRNSIIQGIRQKRDRDLQALIHSIWRSPGFAGIREQVKKFDSLIKVEWKRARKASEQMPDIPTRIGYVRRLKDVGSKLSTLRRNVGGKNPDEDSEESRGSAA